MQAEKARAEASDEAAMPFETHRMMAEHMNYEDSIRSAILDEKLNTQAAVTDTAIQFADIFATRRLFPIWKGMMSVSTASWVKARS